MSTGKRKCLLLAVVCVFAFAGGIAGSLMTSGLLYAESEKYDVLDDLLERIMKIESIVEYDEDINSKLGYFNHIRSDLVESRLIQTNSITAKNFNVLNKNGHIVAKLSSTPHGNPVFKLYSRESPQFEYVSEGKKLSSLKNDPGLIITMFQDEPVISFHDKDRDQRIYLGITQLEPQMVFYYRGKTRLAVGSNNIIDRKTGKKIQIEGSVISYDNDENVLSAFPRLKR